jgi:hypothetical protein
MTTSAYFMDLNPQYRDNGCPSQCMGMNEYTSIPNMYTFDTDPKTPLLAAGPMNPYGGVNSTMPEQPRVATQPPQTIQPQIVQPQVQTTVAPSNGDLFANVANVDPSALTNLSTNFGYLDPDMNYRMKYGAINGTAPTGLVYPVSGSIKNRVASRYSDVLKDARLPSNVSTFGYDYPKQMPPQGYAMSNTNAPIRLTYPRV